MTMVVEDSEWRLSGHGRIGELGSTPALHTHTHNRVPNGALEADGGTKSRLDKSLQCLSSKVVQQQELQRWPRPIDGYCPQTAILVRPL